MTPPDSPTAHDSCMTVAATAAWPTNGPTAWRSPPATAWPHSGGHWTGPFSGRTACHGPPSRQTTTGASASHAFSGRGEAIEEDCQGRERVGVARGCVTGHGLCRGCPHRRKAATPTTCWAVWASRTGDAVTTPCAYAFGHLTTAIYWRRYASTRESAYCASWARPTTAWQCALPASTRWRCCYAPPTTSLTWAVPIRWR